jgi:hypothetical protein
MGDTQRRISQLREQVETIMRERVTPAVTDIAGRAETAVRLAAPPPNPCGLNSLVRVSEAWPIPDGRIDLIADEPLSKVKGVLFPWRSNMRSALEFGQGCGPCGLAGRRS